MKTNSIIISEKKKVLKYSPKNDAFKWELNFKHRVTGISRIDDYVFVTTSSNWGKQSTNLIYFESGEILWTKDEIFYSIHIIDDLIIYANKTKHFCGINLKTGVNIFSTKSPFKWWATPKTMLLNRQFYLYTSNKVFLLNLKNGSISESKLPNKLDPKEISLVLDEFQININNLPSANGGGDAHAFIGDASGGDVGGGDAGVGGDAGGGGDA